MQYALLLVISFLFWIPSVTAQVKYEKEYRLKPGSVPADAVNLVQSLGFSGKIHWYAEEGIDVKTIEAKTLQGKKRYSIEFDTLGNFLDLEVDTGWDEVPPGTAKRILTYLDSVFTKHKTMKIQAHYNGPAEAIPLLLNKGLSDFLHMVKYEMVIKGKTTHRPKLYEYMFLNDGQFESSSEIVFRNTDNLEF